jgi:HD domain
MEQQFTTLASVRDAYKLLEDLGASTQLIQHVKLVGEAAEILISQIEQFGFSFDRDSIRLGVAFHDTGKILHPSELVEKGNRHEAAGEILLLAHGVDPKIARCCRSHGQWQQLECSFEELVIALADCLWKGKRNPELEHRVIAAVAIMCDRDYWDIFVDLDSGFERVAADGDLRLSRSIAI